MAPIQPDLMGSVKKCKLSEFSLYLFCVVYNGTLPIKFYVLHTYNLFVCCAQLNMQTIKNQWHILLLVLKYTIFKILKLNT